MDNKRISTGQIVAFGITFVLTFLVVSYLLSENEPPVNETLVNISKEMNRSMPKMLDAETRLDSTSVGNSKLNYHYTLINFPKDSMEIDFEAVKLEMMEKAQSNLDTNPVMKEYRKNNIALQYIFRDKNKNQVFDYTVKHQSKKINK